MTWLRALKETGRSGLQIERTRLEPLVALRGAAGVAIVIGLSLWLSSPGVAASSAFGAFASGTATFQRSWRSRPVLALAAGAGLAVSTFLGYLAASNLFLFVVLLAVWSFLAGMAWALGPTSGIVAALTVAVMLVVVTLPTSVMGALVHAGVIAFGGLVQASLILVFPIRRWGAQRDALADAFAAEADYARRLRQDPHAPFDPEPLMTARSAAAVTPWEARRRPEELHGKRALAERIRPVLASLADPSVGAAAEGPERDRARELLTAAASVLDAVARAIRQAKPVRLPKDVKAFLKVPEPEAELTGSARRAAARLIGLLVAAVESADGSGPSDATESAHLLRPTLLRLVPLAARAIRREMHWQSPVFRHAVRMSTVAAAGYLIGAALPLGHGYWAPMASVMVMRPDFSQTYARGSARFAGTLVGVAVATGVMQAASPGVYLCAGLAVLAITLMYLLMRTGYAVSQACLAAYAVLLLGMGGSEWTQTVPERVLLTLLGGVLAMAAYAVFPAWETPRLRDRLAERLEATAGYTAAVLEGFADPAKRRSGTVREALLDARAAGAAWNQAVARADSEPVRHRGLSRRAAQDADAALSAMGRAGMLMEAHLPGRNAEPVPAAAEFARVLREAVTESAQAVRDRDTVDWDAVRVALDGWHGDGAQERMVRRGAELLVDTLDEFEEAVRSRSGSRAPHAQRP
ncbi:FUSC family protein [Streptomyces sp. H10-C2]|uniref:FUSC family protein n=1 Tax=unclassified Streptomyces TaxID=2593676 RepID=UPI0024B933B5|nr:MULTISPECIES: FUSC family protein [unclassified Streptomyces]MDJ0345217.1 FUSC family protein [Streptomyces sp. PH10-H1]MDJ0368837.1 FUSC family protein [Streptomyces sp. H10-C2]